MFLSIKFLMTNKNPKILFIHAGFSHKTHFQIPEYNFFSMSYKDPHLDTRNRYASFSHCISFCAFNYTNNHVLTLMGDSDKLYSDFSENFLTNMDQ